MERIKDHPILQKILRSRAVFLLEVVVSVLVGVTLVFPILGVGFALNEVFRLITKLFLWLIYGDKVQLCDDEIGVDYALMGDRNERHVVLYLGEVEGKVDVEHIREMYQKRVIENKVYEKLTRTFEWKWFHFYMCMKKCEDFDIRNHVRYYPGTEDRIVKETELLQTILPDLSKQMEGSMPKWEEVIIPYYQRSAPEDDKTVSLRIIRMHHSYMDGASTLIMIANTFCDEGANFPYVIDPRKPLKISRVAMLLYKLASLALFSSTIFKNLINPTTARARSSRFNLLTKGKGKVLFGWTKKIPIEKFQSIKNKSGVSMPAIVSTVLSGALRSLELKYPSGAFEDMGKVLTPHRLWMVAGVFPVDENSPGNKHLAIETPLDISDLSGINRLAQVNDELGRLAKNPLTNLFYWYMICIGRIPILISNFILSFAICPMILSNIPLSTEKIHLWGQKCHSIVGWVPLIARGGIGIVSVRYADHFRYCIQADSNAMSQEELTFFARQLEEEVEELIYETSQLKRKISKETGVFHTKKDDAIQSRRSLRAARGPAGVNDGSSSEVENEDSGIENDDSAARQNNNIIPNCILNNNNNDNSFSSELGSVAGLSTNFSIIHKLKDSIGQLKESLRKIKEQ